MKKYLSIFLLFLASCQTIVVPEITKKVRNDIDKNLPKIENEKGQICFYRLKALVGSGYSPDVFVNNEKVGEISNNSYFCKNFTPGNYNVKVEIPLSSDLRQEVSVVKNKRKYILVTYENNKEIEEVSQVPALGYLYTIIHK